MIFNLIILFLLITIILLLLLFFFNNYNYFKNLKIIKFNGRPDGLGNRIEELINLECLCISKNMKCLYYWNNSNSKRIYPYLFNCKNIKIVHKPFKNLIKLYFENCINNNKNKLKAIKNISYFKNININLSYISVHIRSTDRITKDGKGDFVTYDIFIKNFNNSILFLNTLGNINLVVVSDNDKYKELLIKQLNNNIKIIDPFQNIINNNDYKDFYSLVYSKKILMVPKFSSYAATASLLGNNILLAFNDAKKSNIARYNTNIKYIN